MPGVRSALVIATYAYDDQGLARLRAPEHDAQALASVLGDPRIGEFEVDTVLNATAHEVRLAVARFFKDHRPDDLLLLHVSCHGVKDDSGELYFAAADTQLELLEATGVSASFVNQAMSRSRAGRIVLLLDCCYAGAFTRGMVPRAAGPVDVNERLGGRGRAVMTASSALQYAFEGTSLADGGGEDPGPSVFTSALVRGLATGEADRDLDGIITFDELYAYVHDEVTHANPHQTPKKWTFDVDGDLQIAQRVAPPASATRIAAPGEEPGASGPSVAGVGWPAAADPVTDAAAAPTPGLAAGAGYERPVAPERTQRPVDRRRVLWWVAGAAAAVIAVVLGFALWPDGDGSPGAPTTGDLAGETEHPTLAVSEAVLTREDGGQHGLVAVDLDSGTTRLVLSDTRVTWPTVSHDREWLLYLRDGTAGYGVPHLVRADGSEDAPLLPFWPDSDACPFSSRPAFSHDGGLVAIVCVGDDGRSLGLFVFDWEDLFALVESSEVVAGDVTWTGDREIVFARSGARGDSLWVVAPDGSREPEQLTTGEDGWDSSPDWSHEGVLFVRSSQPGTGEGDAWLLTPERRLTRLTSRGDVSSPTWAPGGEVFAYLAPDEDGSTTLWRQRLRDDPEAALTGDLGPPAWGGR